MANAVNIQQALAQLRSMSDVAKSGAPDPAKGSDEVRTSLDFQSMLKNAVDKVNDTQKSAAMKASAYEEGDPNIELSDVMVSLQKASVSFQAMTQVRNKLITAYEDIKKMS